MSYETKFFALICLFLFYSLFYFFLADAEWVKRLWNGPIFRVLMCIPAFRRYAQEMDQREREEDAKKMRREVP